MGLQLTVSKENNSLSYDFIDAYWSIDNIMHEANSTFFTLNAYPNREAKFKNKYNISWTLGIGGPTSLTYSTKIYSWEGSVITSELFKEAIPVDLNIQKTILYSYIKHYTGLPFKDVFEEDSVLEDK